MSRYSGKQYPGAARDTRQRMRSEAEARQRAERERDQRRAAEHRAKCVTCRDGGDCAEDLPEDPELVLAVLEALFRRR